MRMQRRAAVMVAMFFALTSAAAVARGEDCYGWNPNQACEAQATSLGSCLGCCGMIYDCRVFSGRCGVFCREIALTEFSACQGHCMAAFG